MVRRSGLLTTSAVLIAAIGCGRTDSLWFLDDLADAGTSDPTDTGPGPGDGDWGTSTTTGDGDGDWGTETTTETSDTSTGDGDGAPTGDGDGAPTGDGDGAPTGDGDGGPCTPLEPELSVDPATVIFLIDQGAHMDNNFGGGLTRLEAIGAALFDPMQGVAYAWEAERRLGLVGFTSIDGDQGGECPQLLVEAPELVTAMAMEASFAGLQAIDENPVADAIAASVPLFDGEPGHLILLTGRNPDTCAQPNPQQGADEAIAAAQQAFSQGVQTHLVAVGNLTGSYPQQLANAGVGLDPLGADGDEPWGSPGSVGALVASLDGLLQGMTTCSLTLSEPVFNGTEDACTVFLDGQAVPFGADGWSLPAPDQLTLDGAACTALQQGAVATMTCACE